VAKINIAGFPVGFPLFRKKMLGLPLTTMPVGVESVPAFAKPGGGTKMKSSNELPAGSGKKLAGTPLPV
jgi:hypothetical protein